MDRWCGCDAGGHIWSLWIQPCFGSTSQAGVFTLLLPVPSQAVQENRDNGLLLTTTQSLALSSCSTFFWSSRAVICLPPACPDRFLPHCSLMCNIESQQWTISPFGFPSDPWWKLKDWTSVAFAKLFNIYHVNVEMFKKKKRTQKNVKTWKIKQKNKLFSPWNKNLFFL